MAIQRLLILGANGVVGRMVHAALRAEFQSQWECVGVARDGSSDVVWQPGQTGDLLPKAEGILALWGVTPGEGRDLSLNTTLAMNAMTLAKQVGAGRVIHCSSAAVYGASDQDHDEQDALNGTSPYALSKIAMEQALMPSDITQTSLRIGNVVGADSLGQAIRRGSVAMDQFPDGSTPLRSYIAPGDLARVLIGCLEVDTLPTVMNVASPVPIEMGDLARAAGQKPVFHDAPQTAMSRAVLKTDRLTRTLGDVIQCRTPEQMIADWRKWDITAP